MTPTHCIFYTHVDRERRPATETTGTCIDNYDKDYNHLKCADVIAAGKCSKKRTTPVIK